MMLIALATWVEKFPKGRSALELRGDAKGVLQAVMARRAKSTVINSIIAEIQLALGTSMYDIYTAHIWSDRNHISDKLSRLDEGADFPTECKDAERSRIVHAPWRILGAK